MALVWHRELTTEDVETANFLLEQHAPAEDVRGVHYCANGGHWSGAPWWPCARAQWAREVLAAEQRGEVVR